MNAIFRQSTKMAEAGVETASSSARFFCHKCNVEITPQLPDYVCPRCNSGFIEELDRARDSDSDSSSDTEMEPYDMWDVITQDSSSVSGAASPAASSSGPGPRRSQRLRHINPRHGRRRVSGDDKGLQCSVCMEDFTIDESVRRLYCEHCFHNDCIIPWLELHGTCPICRKLLLEDVQATLGASAASSGSNNSTNPGSR
nr:E3 ubiquitin-protein ligase RNF126-A-like [Cherax quadricarinatus]